jgi:hypothetical protein
MYHTSSISLLERLICKILVLRMVLEETILGRVFKICSEFCGIISLIS